MLEVEKDGITSQNHASLIKAYFFFLAVVARCDWVSEALPYPYYKRN
jgi:hypothetical protein